MDISKDLEKNFKNASIVQFLGAKLIYAKEGKAKVKLPFRHELTQDQGVIHGGILTLVADTACWFAAASARKGIAITSAEIKINFLKPGVKTNLIATAEVVKTGRRVDVTTFEVKNGDGEILAIGLSTLMVSDFVESISLDDDRNTSILNLCPTYPSHQSILRTQPLWEDFEKRFNKFIQSDPKLSSQSKEILKSLSIPSQAAQLADQLSQGENSKNCTSTEGFLFAAVWLKNASHLAPNRNWSDHPHDRATACTYYLKAAEEFCRLGDMKTATRAFLGAAEVFLVDHQFSQARSFFEQGLKLAIASEDHYSKATHLLGIGRIAHNTGDMQAALNTLEASEKTYQKLNDLCGVSSCALLIGRVYMNIPDSEKAKARLDQALENFGQINHTGGLASTYKTIGDLKIQMSDLKAAQEAYNKALSGYEKSQNQLGKAQCYQALGNLALLRNRVDQAFSFFEKALKFHLDTNDSMGVAGDLGYLGRTAARAGLQEQAILFFENSLKVHRAIGAQWGVLLNLREQGDAFFILEGQTVPSLACLYQAVEIAKALKAPEADSILERFTTIWSPIIDKVPQEAQKLKESLANDAESLRAQGIQTILEAPDIATLFFEDQLAIARMKKDRGGIASSLGSQALALAEAGHHEGAIAALDMARSTIQDMPSKTKAIFEDMIEEWQEDIAELSVDLHQSKSTKEIKKNAEKIRFEAVGTIRKVFFSNFSESRKS